MKNKKILILGGAGFIGTNLCIELAKESTNRITVIDQEVLYFANINSLSLPNVKTLEIKFNCQTDYINLIRDYDIVYHLVSTTNPSNSNLRIAKEIEDNVSVSSLIFEACISNNIEKVVFISSGGTVYGKEVECPIKEDATTNPICSYGIQKLAIEKLLYLYRHTNNLNYNIVRLANPYGPYQRPNGILGALTTFIYKTLKKEPITIFGDGNTVRDYIYITDTIKAIINITKQETKHNIYNIGTGRGISLNNLLYEISNSLQIKQILCYQQARKVDVPINYLNTSRYEEEFGKIETTTLEDGIINTANFLIKNYGI